jgi:predicted  nucleic acid-binding Zn-ribbon protein
MQDHSQLQRVSDAWRESAEELNLINLRTSTELRYARAELVALQNKLEQERQLSAAARKQLQRLEEKLQKSENRATYLKAALMRQIEAGKESSDLRSELADVKAQLVAKTVEGVHLRDPATEP